MSSLLKNKIKDPVFTSSIKWAIGFFMFPAWWLIVYFAVSFGAGNQIAVIVALSQIVLLFIRQEFMKMAAE